MEKKFLSLLTDVIEANEGELTPSTRFRDLKNWDSIKFLSVLVMIDEEYDVIIEGGDFQKLTTIEDIIKEIKKRKQL